MIYRVNAGQIPDDHWLADRRQGGRLLGEATHFIDTCNALVGSAPVTVYARDLGRAELILEDSFTVTLGYPNGSQASIIYSAIAPTGGGKERLEILSDGRAAVIDDYHTLSLTGSGRSRKVRYKPADKGHGRELAMFAELVKGRGDITEVATSAFATSRAAFAAVQSLATGRAVAL